MNVLAFYLRIFLMCQEIFITLLFYCFSVEILIFLIFLNVTEMSDEKTNYNGDFSALFSQFQN